MKRIAATLLVAVLVISLVGCGGKKEEEGDAASLSLLTEAAAAMAKVESFRMKGSIELDAGAAMPGGQGQVIDMEVAADLRNVDGDIRQHMTVSIGDFVTEAYIVGGIYYQKTPDEGWMKMSSGAYISQNMGLGMANPEQMDLMARMARNARVVEENDDSVVLSLRLDEEYMRAAMDLLRESLRESGEEDSGEWLDLAEESIAGFQADIRMWIGKDDNLIRRIETTYAMGEGSRMGKVNSSMVVELADFGADIVVELPEEAAQAKEFDFQL